MKKILLTVAVAMMTAMCALAQKIEVVDADGNGIPLVSVTTEDGVYIGKTDLNGVLADVKGARKVGLSHVAYDIKNDYKPKARHLNSMGVFANKAPGWHRAEIAIKAEEMCKRNKGAMTEKWVTKGKLHEAYGLSVTKDGANRWRVENPKGKVGQIVHNGGQSYSTLDAARMQRYQDEKQGNKSLMKKRQEKDYAYEYADIYRLPGDDDGDIPDLARLVMAMHHWELNSDKGRQRDIYYAYVVTHSYANEAEFKARYKELSQGHQSDMTLEELQAYEREHNIPALVAPQLSAIKALKKHY